MTSHRTAVLIFILTLMMARAAWADVLEDLVARTATIESLSGTFQQSRSIDVLPMPLRSHGRFSYHYQEGLTWQTESPVKTVARISPGGVAFEDSHHVKTDISGSVLLAEILLGIFSGDMVNVRKHFSVDARQEGENWSLMLSPLAGTLSEFIMTISVSGSRFTESLSIYEANNDVTHILFDTTQVSRFVH